MSDSENTSGHPPHSQRGAHTIIVSTQKGCEKALQKELELLGAPKMRRERGAFAFESDATLVARANMFARTAQRVLILLDEGDAPTEQALYEALFAFDFERFLSPTDSFAVTAHLSDGACLTHSHYAAIRVKDAVVDRFRERGLQRPLVDPRDPSVRFVLHLGDRQYSLALDTSGEPLHKRGYRREPGEAPMKENLAAAILAIGPADIRRPFIDPTCGSGTLAIEQAFRVLDRAPGLTRAFAIDRMQRDVFALKPALRRAREEAKDRAKPTTDVEIRASDWHPTAIAAVTANVRAAGLSDIITIEQVDARKAHLDVPGVVIAANLPFGERLGEKSLQLDGFYRTLGEKIRALQDARILLFTAYPDAEKLLGLGEPKRTSLPSAKLPSMLLRWDVGGRVRT